MEKELPSVSDVPKGPRSIIHAILPGISWAMEEVEEHDHSLSQRALKGLQSFTAASTENRTPGEAWGSLAKMRLKVSSNHWGQLACLTLFLKDHMWLKLQPPNWSTHCCSVGRSHQMSIRFQAWIIAWQWVLSVLREEAQAAHKGGVEIWAIPQNLLVRVKLYLKQKSPHHSWDQSCIPICPTMNKGQWPGSSSKGPQSIDGLKPCQALSICYYRDFQDEEQHGK